MPQKSAKPLMIYTVGHSNHTLQHFVKLLQSHGVTAVADVRTQPYSAYNSQFNRESLSAELKGGGIAYVFVGAELGARPSDESCYENGRVKYERLSETDAFKSGIDRVVEGASKHRVALMCAEKDPLNCHRSILISRALEARSLAVRHILADGSVESHADTMTRLLDLVGLPQTDMFRTRQELLQEACSLREADLAFATEDKGPAAGR